MRSNDLAIPPKNYPKDSWWISDGTRQGFMDAYRKEEARILRQKADKTPGQDRTRATKFGRI